MSKKKKKHLYNLSWIHCSSDGLWRYKENITLEEAVAFASTIRDGVTTINIENAEDDEYE